MLDNPICSCILCTYTYAVSIVGRSRAVDSGVLGSPERLRNSALNKPPVIKTLAVGLSTTLLFIQRTLVSTVVSSLHRVSIRDSA